MGTNRTPTRYRILGIPDSRISFANVAAQGAGALDSDFDQGGPRPGTPAAEDASGTAIDTAMVLEATGSQSAGGHLEVRTQVAGHPGIEEAAYVFRDVTGGMSTSQLLGHDGYQLVTGWGTLRYVTSGTYVAARLTALRLASGQVLVVGDQRSSVDFYWHTARVYNPAAGTWAGYDFINEDSVADRGPAVVQLPNGRVLLFTASTLASGDPFQIDQYYSDDDGATWAIGARRCLKGDIGGGAYVHLEMAAAYNAGEIVLFVSMDTGAGAYVTSQFYSTDDGCTFRNLTTAFKPGGVNEEPRLCTAIPLPGAGFLVVYYDALSGSERYKCTRISSAAADDYTTPVNINSTNSFDDAVLRGDDPAITAWADEDGVLYTVYRTYDSTLTTFGRHTVIRRSTDYGETWLPDGNGDGPKSIFCANRHIASNTASLRDFGATSTAGRGILATRWNASTAVLDPASVGVVYLGGYSTHTAPSEEDYTPIEHVSWGALFNAAGYLPIEEPATCDWTAIGGAGTDDLLTTNGDGTLVLEIDTTGSGNQRGFERTHTGAASQRMYERFTAEVISGGSQVADAVGAEWRCSDGAAFTYRLTLRMSSTGWRFYDPIAAANVGGVVTASGIRHHVVVIDSTGKFQSWHSNSAGNHKVWTVGPNGSLSNGYPTGSDNVRVFWGGIGASNSRSQWHWLGHTPYPKRYYPGGSANIGDASTWSNPASVKGISFGYSPRLLIDGVRIAARSGPTVLGDRWQVRPDYDYGIERIHIDQDPSPSNPWRSIDTTQQIITWDWLSVAGASRFPSGTIVLALLGGNFADAVLEGYPTGGPWTALVTANAYDDFGTLGYALDADRLRVNTGSGVGVRHFFPGELRGCWVRLVNGGTTKYRRIRDNEEGAWRDSATTHKPVIYLEGVDGTEPATGTLHVGQRNMVYVAQGITGTYEAVRLRLPVQTTVDGYFELGQVLLGRAVPLSPEYGWGYARTMQPRTETTERPSGRRRTRRLGPPIKEVEIAWPDGSDLSQLLIASPDPDYVADHAASPIGSWRGAPLHLWHRIGALGGPATPVLWVGRIDPTQAVQQVSNPYGWVYGEIVTAPRLDNDLGDDMESELVKTPRLLVRGLP